MPHLTVKLSIDIVTNGGSRTDRVRVIHSKEFSNFIVKKLQFIRLDLHLFIAFVARDYWNFLYVKIC